jgi:formylglycine-generating enzyme
MKIYLLFFAFLVGSVFVHSQEMIEVKAGSFTMGNASFSREIPIRTVNISRYFLSKQAITNTQFAAFLNAYGSDTIKDGAFIGKPIVTEDSWGVLKVGGLWKAAAGYESFPVVKVTWFGADAFCKAAGGRLPTEAEWEYAAKGGPSQQTYTFSGSSTATTVAWFYDNSNHLNSAVGLKTANTLGLFDMSGNVYQWCSDWFGRYGDFGITGEFNPKGPSSGVSKVIRGGYRSLGSGDLHLSNRESLSPDETYNFVGFRLAMDNLPTDASIIKDDVLSFYPNPTSDLIHLSGFVDVRSLDVLNMHGTILLHQIDPTGTLSLQSFPDGTYLLRIASHTNILVQKLQVKH